MYQIRYECGYEIQVIGELCRISNFDNKIVFYGTYAECEQWLEKRAVKPLSKP